MSGSFLPTRPIAPPDFVSCGPQYGTDLTFSDCIQAALQFPAGDQEYPYIVNGNSPPYFIPYSTQSGNCHITLEQAGPTHILIEVMLKPNDIREMIANIFQQCIEGYGGYGGYQTFMFANMRNFVVNPRVNLQADPYPSTSSFITVTIRAMDGDSEPGDRNIQVPASLGSALFTAADYYPLHSMDHVNLLDKGKDIYARAMQMDMGSPGPWWQLGQAVQDNMDYECDATLGAPKEVDCSKLQYSQLGGGGQDSVMVGPGTTKVIESGTCDVSITASQPTTITWQQIQVAVKILVDFCVGNPIRSSIGGKAHYGQDGTISGLTKRSEKRSMRRGPPSVNGFNALPPSVTVTLYAPGHFEPQ